MTELLTAAQMRAVERMAMDSGAVTGVRLMERAGAGVVAAIAAEWPGMAPGRALVLCGPGNNGGDGFVVARLLAEKGWAVEVRLLGDAGALPPDARLNHDRWLGIGAVGPMVAPVTEPMDLVVDALFGIGLKRPVELPLAALTGQELPGWRPRVVAVDVPSGLCADSGRVIGAAVVQADLTVTFHRPKPGHLLDRGPELCGRLRVVDIGLPATLPPGLGAGVLRALTRDGLGLPDRLFKRGGHKFSHGHAVILSGGPGHGGAARLAARAALRIGAGLVTLACPPAALAENAARLDAVMLRPLADAAALEDMLDDARITALCLGPGLGTAPPEAALLAAALRAERRPMVLDADALTLIGAGAVPLSALHPGCVLTPHAGEFARLFPDLAVRLAAPSRRGPLYSRAEAARAAAARAGCVVLMKGPDTVIAAPDGRCVVSAAVGARAAPWLATAGSGDVLAGFIAGLLARGFDAFAAACTGAWLHVDCALAFGPGLIAEDLPEQVPVVLRAGV